LKAAVQILPQLIPAGVLVTTPLPVPDSVIDTWSVLVTGGGGGGVEFEPGDPPPQAESNIRVAVMSDKAVS
jgi:hypothetical protein